MSFIPINRNTIALITVALIGLGFFAAGLTKTLDYFIIKALLFLSFTVLIVLAIFYGIKNRPSENQDD
jgi:hypothetical protein